MTQRPDQHDPAAGDGTWTFVGHWENGRIVVEYVLPGDVQDQREDTGYWEEGLFAAAGTGPTQRAALRAVRDEYEDIERCGDCGRVTHRNDEPVDTDAADGFDGLCGNCADRAEEAGRWSS